MEHPYERLLPDMVIDAVESLDLLSDQRIFPLNSYENRVYRVGLEESAPCIAKFYRPQRWDKEAILEEHAFSFELQENDINVVAPLIINGQSLHEFEGFQFALFPMQGGYAPELELPDTMYRIGLNIGRMHQVGSSKQFEHRQTMSLEQWAINSRAFLLENDFLPMSLQTAYDTLTDDLVKTMKSILAHHKARDQRIHGDCHMGNILWREDQAFFVDLDDCVMGPAVQDIWLLLSGDRLQQTSLLSEFLEGYEEFASFDLKELNLIETLRTMRIMNYSAWLAKRWKDPAFPMHFPWFNTERYWSEHILELREQLSALNEPPLQLMP
ncbi:stress response kinase A [Oleiphilus sp. HI0071]|nr:stress response kinase A [Oleiphilus sp. HI0065]KZY81583.1 stress response kinase A [Oleiphilus sp. HI0071]KZZ03756.1 stress response kinase A [Oleiphilus sp. HI0073]KZZ17499.1 stress response kinase A [Oleiphilus sp. HI0080]KZZ52067.1 stress response kinase A [Oleiphilus sp. HI0122]KZZ82329.1 stress response kinase A [Oleiphilus sp. HI0133]